MNIQTKEKEECRFVFLSSGIIKNDGQNLHFTAFDTQLRCRVLIQRFSRKLSKEALSQIQLLRHLEHDNLALVHHVLQLSSSGPCYLVSELLDTTLEQLLLSNQLTFNHASLFAYQLLRGLKYLHSAELPHLCMHPSNTLINVQSLILKISDSWLSFADQNNIDHSYSSPELLMGMEDLGDSRWSDVWSVGCMLMEMVADRNIFQGHDQFDILLRIIDIVALKEFDWMKVFKFFPTRILKNHGCKPRQPLAHFVPAFDASLINLLESMFRFNGEDRISVHNALFHPFFSPYHCLQDEPVVDPDVLRILQRHSEQDNKDVLLGEGCSLEELWSLELQAGFSDNHLLDYLSAPSLLHSSTLLSADHPFGSSHSVHDATKEQSLSSSSSSSVHSAATYRHNLKELQSRLKQRYAGDSDKESAEMSEEKRKEEEEVAMVQQALNQLASVNINDAGLEDKVTNFNDVLKNEAIEGQINDIKVNEMKNLRMDDLNLDGIISNEKKLPHEATNDLQDNNSEVLCTPQQLKQDFVASNCKETIYNRDEELKKKRIVKMEDGTKVSDVWKQEGKQGLETDPFDHTSSHFDHLYRLPTDHLRRYADDMNHSLHGHNFFDATCRTSRLSENGACGGCGFDYGSLDDIPSAFSSSHQLSNSPEQFRQPLPAFLKRSGSDSSFDSPPNSPPYSSFYTGARPKISHKKYFK